MWLRASTNSKCDRHSYSKCSPATIEESVGSAGKTHLLCWLHMRTGIVPSHLRRLRVNLIDSLVMRFVKGKTLAESIRFENLITAQAARVNIVRSPRIGNQFAACHWHVGIFAKPSIRKRQDPARSCDRGRSGFRKPIESAFHLWSALRRDDALQRARRPQGRNLVQ